MSLAVSVCVVLTQYAQPVPALGVSAVGGFLEGGTRLLFVVAVCARAVPVADALLERCLGLRLRFGFGLRII